MLEKWLSKMIIKVQINSKIERFFLCLLLQSVPINKRYIIRYLRDVYIGGGDA